jgi:hypothetical protein
VKESARRTGVAKLARHDLRRDAESRIMLSSSESVDRAGASEEVRHSFLHAAYGMSDRPVLGSDMLRAESRDIKTV